MLSAGTAGRGERLQVAAEVGREGLLVLVGVRQQRDPDPGPQGLMPARDAVGVRQCYLCGQQKDESEFIQRVDDRYYRMCRSCVSEILARHGRKRPSLRHTDTHRTCYLCEGVLPVASFTRRRTDGTYFSACKDCNRHVFAQRRRARLAAVGGSYTVAEWDALVSRHRRCPACLRPWAEIPPPAGGGPVVTADHIVPIARGGANAIDNIQPLCYSCNSRKGVRVPG
jgi:5-methylcytosine-specific restriction endonuclease McrA